MKASIVFFAGGKGTRLWPLSRDDNPKPFVSFFGMKPLIEQLIEMCLPLVEDNLQAIWISTRADLHATLPEHSLAKKLNPILEPMPKDTAPAIGLSAIKLISVDLGNVPTAFIGADYIINPPHEFRKTLKNALTIAKNDFIVTIGIPPTRAATEFGYIKKGESINPNLNAYQVERFVEKPNSELALQYLESGQYFWNSGMFIAKPQIIWEEIQKHSSDIAEHLNNIKEANFDPTTMKVEFEKLPSISFDYAVMEKTTRAAMVQASFNWEDMGNWQSMKRILGTDERGNVIHAPLSYIKNVQNCIIHSTLPVVCSEITDLTIIVTEDVILVTGEKDPQQFKTLVKHVLQTEDFRSFS